MYKTSLVLATLLLATAFNVDASTRATKAIKSSKGTKKSAKSKKVGKKEKKSAKSKKAGKKAEKSKEDPTDSRTCRLIQPEPWNDVGVKVTPVGSVPVVNTDPGSYNMVPVENFEKLYVVDQKEGIIYCFDEIDGVDVVFNATVMEDELELEIAYPEPIWNGGDQRIRYVVQLQVSTAIQRVQTISYNLFYYYNFC